MPEISEAELAELARLREEKAAGELAEARRRIEAAARLTPPTHYVHLADGRVIEGSQHGTHHSEITEDGSERVLRVVAAHPKGA